MGSKKDFSKFNGQIINGWEIIDGRRQNEVGRTKILCKCHCGKIKAMIVNDVFRKENIIKSCGCTVAARNYTTIGTDYPEYWQFKSMHSRCTDKSRKDAKHYSEKGIKVCERWHDFKNFLEDMGSRPSPKHTIERLDNSKDYGPENCKWATWTEQARNTSRNRKVTADDKEFKSVAEAAETYGVTQSLVHSRLERGWSEEDAFKTPVRPKREMTVDGVTFDTLTHAAEHYNIPREIVRGRLRHGWTHEQALKTPIDKTKQRGKNKDIDTRT